MLDLAKLKPAPGYLLIEPLEEEKKTSTGIFLPDSHEQKSQTGKILAVGDPEQTDKGSLKQSPASKGAQVIYKKWSGTEFNQGPGQKELLFVKFEDVVATFSN